MHTLIYGNIPRRAHVTPYGLELGWLSPSSRRDYFTATLAHNVISHRSPFYLLPRFSVINTDITIRSSSRRPTLSLYYPPTRTEAKNCTFVFTASKLINSLPSVSFSPSRLSHFKSSLYTFLLERDWSDWRTRVENEGITNFCRPSE